ncbi:hypothetical protein PAXRUDRAFT_828227 [Paxillus rubicundulus Ve08.2h10]|uniref:Uncharacterized protein n=1 Tax=Paxillus rubicundulus Ve08.2h10 TaxID=930991 RepID=A0A0D0DWF6_9AGAM|nr:hypothetical protein PAXRUDRAFT_828227 [Paxillus rubicundulus Ve08.2h10]
MSSVPRNHSEKTAIPQQYAKCKLLEIVQYSCEPEKLPSGEIRPHCFPVPRIFRVCPNQPVVEITTYAMIDLKTGEIEMPHENSPLPIGKRWQDVRSYGNTG